MCALFEQTKIRLNQNLLNHNWVLIGRLYKVRKQAFESLNFFEQILQQPSLEFLFCSKYCPMSPVGLYQSSSSALAKSGPGLGGKRKVTNGQSKRIAVKSFIKQRQEKRRCIYVCVYACSDASTDRREAQTDGSTDARKHILSTLSELAHCNKLSA